MQYPLEEKIGNPDLLVGREREFEQFNKWIANMPKKLSKSRVILARRKSGKTTFVQRLFNQLWSDNGSVIPFYISIPDAPIWYPNLAVKYYETFASHYISFVERDPQLIRKPLKLEQIREYGLAHANAVLVDDVEAILNHENLGRYDLMWHIAYEAPHRMAAVYDQRILVMIDEFQYLSAFVHRDEQCVGPPIEALPGSFHEVSESKVAPMLATGSYVGWMIDIMGKYLEAGRLSHIIISPYLTEDEGLQAVYKYAEVFEEPITNETTVQINQLCMADPFFISCVMQSTYPGRDLTSTEGVIETVNYEITDRHSEMSGTWNEYIEKTVQRINDRHAKDILLHLSKHNERYWTPKEIKAALKIDLSPNDIRQRLMAMVKGDLIDWGIADIDFRGLQDGTLNLILRNRFEKEIAQHEQPPDLRAEFREEIAQLQTEKKSLQGKLSYVTGQMAENQLAISFRSRKRFRLSDYFAGVTDDSELNVTEVRTRVFIQRADGKNLELDVVAEASNGGGESIRRVLLVEVRKRQVKMGPQAIEDFQEKVETYRALNPGLEVLPAFLSLGGFTDKARQLCKQNGIGWAEQLVYF